MPFLIALLAVAFGLLVFLLMIPLSLVMRYRSGTARQLARGWVATANVWSIGISVVLLLGTATVTTFWVPGALGYTLAGMAAGALLGLLGLALTRWEPSAHGLHFTPNRFLVLAILLVVTARIGWGFWRAWSSWGDAADSSFLAEVGLPGAMGAGAAVVGYYLSFWVGVRRRYRRHQRLVPPANRRF